MKCINNNCAKITFLGDVMIEHSRLNDYQVGDNYSFEPLFEKCSSLFRKSSYVVANLETPVAGEEMGYSFKNYNFNTPEEILYAMKKAGISMVTTANNHCLDRGIEGLNRTIENIKKSGLDCVGTTSAGDTYAPLIKTIANLKIGFLSYTYGTEACYNLNYLNKKNQYQVCLLQNQELSNRFQRFLVKSNRFPARVLRRIVSIFSKDYFKRSPEEFKQKNKKQRARLLSDINYLKDQRVDFIVMCLHSGGQFNDYPTLFTKKESAFLSKHGVDLIVCNHEHLIQTCSLNDNDDIAFCLGNFTSNYGIIRAPFDKRAECSIALHLYLEKIDGKIRRRYSFSVMLSKIDDTGKIITTPLFDEYSLLTDPVEKERLQSINIECIKRFVGKTDKGNLAPLEEYPISDFVFEVEHDKV